jgi:hypothetical protein
MCGAIPPLPHMSPWHGTSLSTGAALPFTLFTPNADILRLNLRGVQEFCFVWT